MAWNATTATVMGIPPYLFFTGIGLLVAFIVFNILCLYKREECDTASWIVARSFIPMVVGAKAVGVIYNICTYIAYQKPFTLDILFNSAIVYYGGLIGFLAGILFFTRKLPLDRSRTVRDITAVCIPLFHAFGRVGCFTAGCCYGVEATTPISVLYTTFTRSGLSTAWRVPIQLIEVGINLILFAVLLTLFLKRREVGRLVTWYVTMYAVCRLVLECFRGEWDRQVFFGISGSQVISVMLLITIGILQWRKRENIT